MEQDPQDQKEKREKRERKKKRGKKGGTTTLKEIKPQTWCWSKVKLALPDSPIYVSTASSPRVRYRLYPFEQGREANYEDMFSGESWKRASYRTADFASNLDIKVIQNLSQELKTKPTLWECEKAWHWPAKQVTILAGVISRPLPPPLLVAPRAEERGAQGEEEERAKEGDQSALFATFYLVVGAGGALLSCLVDESNSLQLGDGMAEGFCNREHFLVVNSGDVSSVVHLSISSEPLSGKEELQQKGDQGRGGGEEREEERLKD